MDAKVVEKMDLSLLSIVKVIIHEVPRKQSASDDVTPIYSEVESKLDSSLSLFFREKIITSAGSKNAFAVEFDPESQNMIPVVIKEYLVGQQTDFVTMSQNIAHHLGKCQTRVNPGGLLTVIDCMIEAKRALAILKVEKEDGVRLNQSNIGGKLTFNIHYLKDLLLTKKTKLFKIGLFIQSGPQIGDIDSVISDYQRGLQTGIEVARFFLQSFLGCRLKEDPTISTKRFFEATEAFINTEILDSTEKRVLHAHLISQMFSQSTTLNPESFAREYLPTELRQKFIDHLEEKKVSIQVFDKEIDLIEKHIKNTSLIFASGIVVTGSNEVVGDYVKLSDAGQGKTRLEIEDILDKVVGK